MRMNFRALYLREQQEKSARQMSGSTQHKGKGRCVPLIGGGGLASGSKRTHPVATCNMIFFSDMREVLVVLDSLTSDQRLVDMNVSATRKDSSCQTHGPAVSSQATEMSASA